MKFAQYIRSFFSTSGLFNILCWVAFLSIGIVTGRKGVAIISFIFLVMALSRRKMLKRRAILPDLFWEEFVGKNPDYRDAPHQIWRVRNRPVDEINIIDRIDKGEVSGEAFLTEYFDYYNEPLPQVGDLNIICDDGNNPYFLVRTTEIIHTEYGAVTNELARIEGHKSATIWKSGNEDKFQALCNSIQTRFTKNTPIFFEKFEIAFKPEVEARKGIFFKKNKEEGSK